MSLLVFNGNNSTNKKFEIASEGAHPATLGKVKDLGNVETKFGPKHRVRFVWQLKDECDANGKPTLAFQAFNVSFDPKSQLHKAVKQILGQVPLSTFDLESLEGTQATIVVEHNIGNDGVTYANISAVIPSRAVRQ